MFGLWNKRPEHATLGPGMASLEDDVRRELRTTDEETVRVVAAIAGLLGTVAYADRDYSAGEEERVRHELGRISGMTAAGVDAICATLRRHVVEISTVQAPRFSRTLLELGDRELRLQVLETLTELAASDGVLSMAETNLLRQVTTALGLTQDDYNSAQAKHRERLSILSRS